MASTQSKQMRLQVRIRSYEDTCRSRSDSGKGFKKPGSMSGKK